MTSYRTQRVFGITGRSGSGKTRLITRLIRYFRDEGLSVSTIKHTHHGVDMDVPGKDTFLHRESGAGEVMLATPERWVLQHSCVEPPRLEELLRVMRPVDLVLVEGFHATVPACLEVWRSETEKAPLFPEFPVIRTVVSDDRGFPESGLTVFSPENVEAIAEFIRREAVDIVLS